MAKKNIKGESPEAIRSTHNAFLIGLAKCVPFFEQKVGSIQRLFLFMKMVQLKLCYNFGELKPIEQVHIPHIPSCQLIPFTVKCIIDPL